MNNTKKGNKFTNWVDNKAMPVMGRIGNQRHLSSIRDGFALVTPIIIAGAIGILMVTMVFGGWGAGRTSILGLLSQWSGHNVGGKFQQDIFGTGDPTKFVESQFESLRFAQVSYIGTQIAGQFNTAGLGSISLIFAFAFGYFLSQTRNNDNPVMGGLVSLGAFLASTAGNSSYFGANGLLTAILMGIVAVEVYCKTSTINKLKLQLPTGVPPAVSRSFAKLFPVIIALVAVMGVFALVAIPTFFTHAKILSIDAKTLEITTVSVAAGYWNPADLINSAVQAPMIAVASLNGANLGIAIFYTLGIGLLWFFGLHGTNVMNAGFQVIWTTLLTKNADFLSKGTLSANGAIFAQGTFDAYIFFGGTEATMGLLFATFMFSKRAEEVEIAKYALPAGVFNINEPVVFGYPLVVNFKYVIPTVLTMPILTLTTWMGYELFDTTKVAIQVPWTAPAGIGALFATSFDYTSFIIAAFNLLVTTLIWTPFVIFNSRKSSLEIDVKPIEATIKGVK